MRLLSFLVLSLSAMGCGGREGEYKSSGVPAVKLELRAGARQAAEGWNPFDDPNERGEPFFVSPSTVLANADIASSGVEERQKGPGWMVVVWLNEGGKTKLAKASSDLYRAAPAETRRYLVMLVDGKLVSAPLVASWPLPHRLVFGLPKNYTEAEARKLAKGIVGQ